MSLLKWERQPEFNRNPALETLLLELNSDLVSSAAELKEQFPAPNHPTVFIVGCSRSGTTLLHQWLAASGTFTYPSNLVSRFYNAPHIGARIQQMLCDPRYAYREELAGLVPAENETQFTSTLGKTTGFNSPHEFWYFWRRFFKYGELQRLAKHELEAIDVPSFLAELAAMEAVADKPLAMKALIAQWNLPFLASILPNAVFLHIKRRPLDTMCSLLAARERFYGTKETWYSWKPPEYVFLAGLDPYEQVAGQVFYTHKAILTGLETVGFKRSLELSYEKFCSDPQAHWPNISKLVQNQGYDSLPNHNGPHECQKSAAHAVTEDEFERLNEAYIAFGGEDLSGEKDMVLTNETVSVNEI